MDQDTHDVQVGDVSVDLSPTEFKLLRYLMLNPNRVLSKAQILDHVWEYDFNGDAGIVESYISYLRRTMQDDEEAIIRAGELTMDQDTHEVTVGDSQVELSPTEFKLLRYLMLNPNRVLSKAQILDHVWEYDFNGDAGIVESYVSYLRRKLDQYTDEPMIQTKRGFGYMLKVDKS